MKKLFCITKKAAMLLLAVMLFQAGAAQAAKLDIVLVGDLAVYDQPTINFLQELYGNTAVIDYTAAAYQTLDSTKIARLNAANLVVMGRRCGSGTYATDATETTQWNNLTTKLILMTPYLSRNTHWKWFDSTAISGTADAGFTTLQVAVPSDPIFNGVTVTGGKVQIFQDPGYNNRPISVSTAHNGQVLARCDPGATKLAIVRWTDTATPYYAGSSETPKGPRLYCAIQDDDQNKSGADFIDQLATLTPDGKKMLQNVFKSMLPIPAAISVNPASTVAFDTINVVLRPGTKSTKDVVITNLGGTAMNFVAQGSETYRGLVVTGSPRVTVKSVSAPTTTPLAPGASLTVTLEFAPLTGDYTDGAANLLNATLNIYTDAANTPTVQVQTQGQTVPVELSTFKVD